MSLLKIPVYQRVRNELLRRIRNGQFSPGEQIASEEELAKEFHASRASVRTALVTLEHESILERRHGIGTFVRRTWLPVHDSFRYLQTVPELIRECGYVPTMEKYLRTLGPGPQNAYDALLIPPQSNLNCVRRVYLASGEKALYILDYLPEYFKGQKIILEDYPDETLKALEVRNGILVDHARCLVTAVSTDAVIAEMLEVSVGVPVLTQITTAYERETPVIFSISYSNPNVIQYETIRQRKD